ncbi:hypothetical protein WA158_005352 [Blastocystis sp. Blastoise]
MLNKFSIIVAATDRLGIGLKGSIPWRLREDMKYFKQITCTTEDPEKRNAVIMGRLTYESLPEQYRPLKDRINYILSRDESTIEKYGNIENVIVCSSLDEALLKVFNRVETPLIEKVFIIGGGQIYKSAIHLPECEYIYITKIHSTIDCDTFFPIIDNSFELTSHSEDKIENEISFCFDIYKKKNSSFLLPPVRTDINEHEEYQYLHMIRHILDHGVLRGDRTGTGTRSVFGTQMRYSLRDNIIPVLTTKRVFWRGVVEELLWFIRGDTNMYHLKDKNIHIWDGNGSREFLDSCGLTEREEGDLGPIYGFQWRHFGADYVDFNHDYSNQGVDQIKHIIETLKHNPNDRRIILSAWNPAALHLMALPPCHVMCQFYVANGELSCQMYQRSCDMGLGVPFNIASYSLLTHILCSMTGLKPGEFIHVMGDTHVYINHRDALEVQLTREPKPFPKLIIKNNHENIDDFVFDDFELVDYNPYGAIKMKMAV